MVRGHWTLGQVPNITTCSEQTNNKFYTPKTKQENKFQSEEDTMAAGGDQLYDPGGGGRRQGASYADRLKTNVNFDQRLKRNVLEITLEKKEKEAEMMLDQESVARLMRSIGMDVMTQVEGYQIQYNGRTSMISVWAAKGVNLEKFCKAEGINVTKDIMTGLIRPAGRRDVTVTVSGLDFNTPDSLVFEYIKKFGGVIVNNSVIYAKFSEGPFKGKCNGERKYQVDFTGSTRSMGTYHYLDGARIRIFYRGNEKTCGRCHRTSRSCPGGGIARGCDQAGGARVHLTDHMKRVWEEIGFAPSSFELPSSDDADGENDKPVADAEKFSRPNINAPVTETDKERYIGLNIANFNIDIVDEEIRKFVVDAVGESIEDKITIVRDKKKAVVTISDSLTADTIREAMNKINFSDCKQKFFGKPLYCRPLRDITPDKKTQADETPDSKSSPVKPSGAIGKKIPGLPPSAQSKAIERQKERERKEKKEKKLKKADKEKMEKEHGKEQAIVRNTSAFDVLMKAQRLQHLEHDPVEPLIPPHCTPDPWRSHFGQQVSTESTESRRISLGSSPYLTPRIGKRNAEQLSSPNSPPFLKDLKKNKSGSHSKGLLTTPQH